jgi:hypothetical protein
MLNQPMFQWLSFGTRRMNRQLLQNTSHVLVNSVWIVDLLTQSSWQTEISVMACRLHPVGNPKRKVWWAQYQVFPQLWNQGYRTSRRKNHTSEGWCTLAFRHSSNDARWMLVHGFSLAATWNLHTTQPRTLPQITMRLSISPVCCKQRIERIK